MIVSIPDEDKIWLESYSHSRHQSVSETIRRAIASYRDSKKKTERGKFLSETAGLWRSRKVDGLEYVRTIRDEWGR